MTNPMAELCGRAIGAVAAPVVECLDVDGVVRKVDVNSLLQRIDMNELLDKVDIDRLLDRVDLNRHVAKVDINSVLERVDVNDIVGRSDMGAIIAQSTTGVFSQVLDKLRTQLVVADLIFFRMRRFQWSHANGGRLPPSPGPTAINGPRAARCPKVRIDQAIAVQGHFTGFISKAVAIFLDTLFVTLSFAGIIIVLQLCWILFVRDTDADTVRKKVSRDTLWVFVMYCVYWVLCFFLTVLVTGQTLGMAIVGIKVVCSRTGEDVSLRQAMVRTAILPLTTTVLPILGIMGITRRDGRLLHDVVAGTGIVYAWDARMAKVRAVAMKRVHQTRAEHYQRGSSTDEAQEAEAAATGTNPGAALLEEVSYDDASMSEPSTSASFSYATFRGESS
ncbi:predicted protein [Phaeodactylum tricornutum CCAP 1055/1]|jgi:uncharacterized RDD family membrane protein YckC|uniref:RDD domain-containing protein n=1 Tax=Phaeodactylum tricornutum (strain CCAP 1055/1) TaxID=556484 RepID=B7GBY8_PHATC|nr:predicted protein [Phaeodactylum tricornutum CCAP 1055/1]EEC44006.1 predicted protein [Phaeodactylum tricornutum CCAP 1055/1]|eukprot:XP_002184607.1 predicted protein [Phaeodactylum tricornutum CCAP 1055/1]